MSPRLPASLSVTERLLSGCARRDSSSQPWGDLGTGVCCAQILLSDLQERHSEVKGNATRTKTELGSKRERKGWGNSSFFPSSWKGGGVIAWSQATSHLSE